MKKETPLQIESILVVSPEAWDMSYDLEASNKKLQELLQSYGDQRAKKERQLIKSRLDAGFPAFGTSIR